MIDGMILRKKEFCMIVVRVMLLLVVCLFLMGCRSVGVTYSTETTTRSTISPWDPKVVDKIELSTTIRRSW